MPDDQQKIAIFSDALSRALDYGKEELKLAVQNIVFLLFIKFLLTNSFLATTAKQVSIYIGEFAS